MKKLFITLSILSVVSTVSASIDTNLKYSMRGSEVSELQEFLIDRGFITGNSTGFFGLLTLKAVKQYQSSISLPATGFVGAMTREKINTQNKKVVSPPIAVVETASPIVSTQEISPSNTIIQTSTTSKVVLEYSGKTYKVEGTYPVFVKLKVLNDAGTPVKDAAVSIIAVDGKEYKAPRFSNAPEFNEWTFTTNGFWEYTKTFYFTQSGVNVVIVNAPNYGVNKSFDIEVK